MLVKQASDTGTQCLIRCLHNKSASVKCYTRCFLAKSQRMEAWWSALRKWNSDWWIEFFKVHVAIYTCMCIHDCICSR